MIFDKGGEKSPPYIYIHTYIYVCFFNPSQNLLTHINILIMKYTSLVDMKFALKQFILANKLGHYHPRRLRRFARKKSVFFNIRMRCDKLIERKAFEHFDKLFYK